MKKMRKICLMLLFSFYCQAGYSFNMSFLNDSATANFTAADWTMLDLASEKALSQYPNGKKLSWKNPKTGNHGFVQPLSTFTRNGMKCRMLLIFNEANYQSDKYQFSFCQYGSTWKIAD
ncbi:MAG TPA: RT0821/Lpp0805 family surface protein [Gammaproteobacteria bacterium]|nr:RT0821/Lpp0805 family surface protein [Gammaproteobacteria bacterium]